MARSEWEFGESTVRRGGMPALTLLAFAGLFAAAPARCDSPVPPPCLGSSAVIGGMISHGPTNNCVLRNGQWILASAMSAGQPPPPFPPPGIVVAGALGPLTLHDSLSAEERARLYRLDTRLAEQLGGEGRAAALDAILTLDNPEGRNVRAVMLSAFAKGYSRPELSPDIESIIVARYWQGDFFTHQFQLMPLLEKRRYHSRALLDLVLQELSVTHTWEASRISAALFSYDQPDAADVLFAHLGQLTEPAVGEVALYLLRSGDPRGVAVAQRAMSRLDGAPQYRDYYLDKLGDAVAKVKTAEAYSVLADLLRRIQHDRPGPLRDNQLQRWSGELLRAPRELHVELQGIDPAPVGATPETLRAVATLLRDRPADEALVTDQTAEHLRKLIALDDVAGVREYVARHFDVNTAIDNGTIPSYGSAVMMENLLQAGASPETRDALGNTWLHLVCQLPNAGYPPAWETNRVKQVQALIAAKADVNARNNAGTTPLMMAVESNHPEILRLLLHAGARTDAVDRTGRTAMIMALDQEYRGIVGAGELQQILRQGGAAFEVRHRLRYAPQRHPLWCLAAIALAGFILGLAVIGICRGIAAALGRPFTAAPGLRRGAWITYLGLCGAAAVLLIVGWASPRGSGESAAFAFVYLYIFSLLCAAGLIAIGSFMYGLHFGMRRFGLPATRAKIGLTQ